MLRWIAVAGMVVAAAGAPKTTHIEDRYQLITSADNFVVFLDIDKIETSNSIVNAWVLKVFLTPLTRFSPPGAYTLDKVSFDCANDSSADLSQTVYAADGKISKEFPNPDPFTPNVPGSIVEDVSQAVCGHKPVDPKQTFRSMAVAIAAARTMLGPPKS
jgi:hypothetical protein